MDLGGIFCAATLMEVFVGEFLFVSKAVCRLVLMDPLGMFYAATLLMIFVMRCWSVPRQTGSPLAGADWFMLMRSRAPSGRGPLLR